MTPCGSKKERHEQDALNWYLGNQSREEVDEETVVRWGDWWANAENRSEYEEILQFQLQLGTLRPTRSSEEELLKDLEEMGVNVAPRSKLRAISERLQSGYRYSFLRRHRFALGATCAVLLAFAAGLLALVRLWPVDPGRTYATARGEQREFTLDDGSSITLGGDTSLNVRFTASGRMIVLSHGEGMFRVHHDTDRPFSVCASSGCTTAVGTVFDVRLYSNHVRVWVQEGAVDVAPREPLAVNAGLARNPPHWPPIRLAHGQEVRYDGNGGTSPTKMADLRNAAAWANGSLVYFGRPLVEVIEDVQRYSARRIVLDPAAAVLVYSGSVFQQNIGQWIRGLTQIFPLEVIDCRVLEESIGSETPDIRSMCVSGPDRILVLSRRVAE